jgi:hypothetical protein
MHGTARGQEWTSDMSFRMRRGRGSFSVGRRGPRASYRLGCALPIFVLLSLFLVGCGGGSGRPAETRATTACAQAFDAAS